MREVAAAHGDAPLSQVALNWCIAQGACVIPGARSLTQLKQNLGATEWQLTSAETKKLDDVSSKLPPLVSPDESPFPKKDKDTGLVMFDS